ADRDEQDAAEADLLGQAVEQGSSTPSHGTCRKGGCEWRYVGPGGCSACPSPRPHTSWAAASRSQPRTPYRSRSGSPHGSLPTTRPPSAPASRHAATPTPPPPSSAASSPHTPASTQSPRIGAPPGSRCQPGTTP